MCVILLKRPCGVRSSNGRSDRMGGEERERGERERWRMLKTRRGRRVRK